MAQDYAEQAFHFAKPKASLPKGVKPFWRSCLTWFLYGCVIGLIFFGLYFWLQSSTSPVSQIKAKSFSHNRSQNNSLSANNTAPIAQRADSRQEFSDLVPKQTDKQRGKTMPPTFDFYTLLPDNEQENAMMVGTTATSAAAATLDAAAATELDDADAGLHAVEQARSVTNLPSSTTASGDAHVSEDEDGDEANTTMATSAPSLARATPPENTNVSAVNTNNQTDKAQANKMPGYLVQVASFRHHRDADELRAQLLLEGFSAKIQQALDNNNLSWHRVVLGPFESKHDANDHCSQMHDFGHDCLVVSRPAA